MSQRDENTTDQWIPSIDNRGVVPRQAIIYIISSLWRLNQIKWLRLATTGLGNVSNVHQLFKHISHIMTTVGTVNALGWPLQ